MSLHDSMSFKSLSGQREKEPLLFLGQQAFLRQGFASELTFKIASTRCFKLLIQRLQKIHLRNGHEEVATSLASSSEKGKESFDMTLLIRTTHQTEMIFKQEVTFQTLARCGNAVTDFRQQFGGASVH